MQIDAEADRLLHTWAGWSRDARDGSRGYPSSSTGFRSGGASSVDAFENLCTGSDIASAKSVDAIIDSLPVAHRRALYEFYLGNGELHVGQLQDAVAAFLTAARRRGVA